MQQDSSRCSLEALQDDEDDDADDDAAGKALQGVQGAADEEDDDDEEEACKGFQGCSLKDDAAGFFKGLQRYEKALKQVQALQAYKIKR